MKTKFNRKDVSSWCKWIAVDKDGKCWEFSKEPFLCCAANFWIDRYHSRTRLLYKGAPPKNWKEELYNWE